MISCSAGDDRWKCSFTNGRFETDADTQSRDGAGNGFRPHELLEAALATCLNMTVRMVAVEADIDVGEVTTVVDVRRESDKTTFAYAIDIDEVTDHERQTIKAGVATCPVHETLTKELVFEDVGNELSPTESTD